MSLKIPLTKKQKSRQSTTTKPDPKFCCSSQQLGFRYAYPTNFGSEMTNVNRNPYLRRMPCRLLHEPDSYNLFLARNSQLVGGEMGTQSQNRNGAIKACKKARTKAKHKRPQTTIRRAIDGGRPFNPEKDCPKCKSKVELAKGLRKDLSHKGLQAEA